jgi:hypothetical protein
MPIKDEGRTEERTQALLRISVALCSLSLSLSFPPLSQSRGVQILINVAWRAPVMVAHQELMIQNINMYIFFGVMHAGPWNCWAATHQDQVLVRCYVLLIDISN